MYESLYETFILNFDVSSRSKHSNENLNDVFLTTRFFGMGPFSGTLLNYVHDFAKYVRLMSSTYAVSKKGELYYFEHIDNRDGVEFIKIRKGLSGYVPAETLSFNHWFNQSDFTAVKFYEIKDFYSPLEGARKIGVDWVPRTVFVSTAIIDQAEIHLHTITAQKFAMEAVIDYVRSLNASFIVNGAEVISGPRMTAPEFELVCGALYINMYKRLKVR